MGWGFTRNATKKDIIARRIAPSANTKTLAHTVRGNVLWTVRETLKSDGTLARWIGCDLLGSEKGWGWGYKDMAESMEPYYFSCPLKYLDMAPVVSAGWREMVRMEAKKVARDLKVGQTVKLKSLKVPEVTLTSVRPLRGVYNGTTYRVPRKMIVLDNP